MENFDSTYFSGQGPLYIAPRDANGKPAGLMFVGDIESAEITPNIEKSTTLENVSGARGVGSSFIKRSAYSISINMRSIKPEHLAQALHGVNTTKAAGTVTDELHTAYQDKMTALAHNKVSAVIVTGTGGTPTHVENTDYIVHADTGMIEILSTGGIADLAPIEIDYSYAAQHHISIDPNNDEVYIVFTGMNNADNDKQTRCELYKVKLDPSALSMITEETATMPISGELLLDSLRSAGDQFYSWKTED